MKQLELILCIVVSRRTSRVFKDTIIILRASSPCFMIVVFATYLYFAARMHGLHSELRNS